MSSDMRSVPDLTMNVITD